MTSASAANPRSRTQYSATLDRVNSNYLWSGAIAAAAALGMLPVRGTLGVLNVFLIFLLVSFVQALVFGAGPAAFGVTVCFLAFDFFYIPPYHTFTIHDPAHVIALFIYLGIAIVTGQLVTRLRGQTEAAIRAESRATMLSQSDRMKSSLLAAVSHDLRSPLAAIKASATSLLDSSVEWDAPARTEFLSAINEETDRLNRMVGNLLDLTRIEAGVLQPDREWYDVSEVIEDVAERLSPVAAAAGHRIDTDVGAALPLVRLDYVEIAQVLSNLVENGIKHTAPGTTIEIIAACQAGEIVVTVQDDGQGVPAEAFDRLFDPFFRSGSGRASSGSGLGLAICRGFVEAHGGRIWAERRSRGGTAFRFTLPLEKQPGISDACLASAAPA
jgi:K+-sensing histidine kinase KdpD